MKTLGFAVIAMVVGYLLGGWMPRTDMYALKTEIEHLKARMSEKGFHGNPSLSGITRLLDVPEQAGGSGDDQGNTSEEADLWSDESTGEVSSVSEEDAGAVPEEVGQELETFEARIVLAAEIWAIRSDIARDAFLSRINASDELAGRFDVLIEAMNVRIQDSISEWADAFRNESMPKRESALRMMHDVTAALVLTYDEMNQNMPVGWSRNAGSDFQLLQLVDFIDPRVATPLIEVHDRVNF